MQTLIEIGFLVALILPPIAVVIGACAVLGSSFVQWRSHGQATAIEERHAVATS